LSTDIHDDPDLSTDIHDSLNYCPNMTKNDIAIFSYFSSISWYFFSKRFH